MSRNKYLKSLAKWTCSRLPCPYLQVVHFFEFVTFGIILPLGYKLYTTLLLQLPQRDITCIKLPIFILKEHMHLPSIFRRHSNKDPYALLKDL